MNYITSTPTHAPGLISKALNGWALLTRLLDRLQPLAALLARAYIAQVFFLSGLTKIRDWGTTVALFSDEYKVPILSPALAAAMGTAGELVLPVLLALTTLGLACRVSTEVAVSGETNSSALCTVELVTLSVALKVATPGLPDLT